MCKYCQQDIIAIETARLKISAGHRTLSDKKSFIAAMNIKLSLILVFTVYCVHNYNKHWTVIFKTLLVLSSCKNTIEKLRFFLVEGDYIEPTKIIEEEVLGINKKRKQIFIHYFSMYLHYQSDNLQWYNVFLIYTIFMVTIINCIST